MSTRSFNRLVVLSILAFVGHGLLVSCQKEEEAGRVDRQRVSINDGWHFYKYGTDEEADRLVYDVRPEVTDGRDDKPADSKPTEAEKTEAGQDVLKPWVMPTGNPFVKDPENRYQRPGGDPGSDFPFVRNNFDDSAWALVDLPHDWAVAGPFYEGWDVPIGGGMGRLPSHGVAWYRKKLDIPAGDKGKSIFLDIDGAMSYAMVWMNGHLVGGWPYGYASFRLDLTPYVVPGGENQLAVRLDNPPGSSRWYTGGGLYRNVWLTRTNPVHVGQWGTFVRARDVSAATATIEIDIEVDNASPHDVNIETVTGFFLLDKDGRKNGHAVAMLKTKATRVAAGQSVSVGGRVVVKDPQLWGPPPAQTPNFYAAVTTVSASGKTVDRYETRFGIRSLRFDPVEGLSVNGRNIRIQGVNQHHDLGALGAAFNTRAAERQLEILREMGCNAIRLAHNPPAPELLELADRMGFLVIDEIFDSWERKKTPLDFHLIFPDWHEQDTRAFVRRDRNHPSVIAWSFGNEVGEQYTGGDGARIAAKLHGIVKEEDPTRPTTASMNFAKPDMPFPPMMDIIGLNYQGEGIRNAPAYAGLKGITTPPLYPAFHDKFPGKLIFSSETASALSTRGTYLFPVYGGNSAPVADGAGGDPQTRFVSAYELYTAAFGSSPDKVFESQDRNPYVAGEFVWSGWDYLGEPTPYYLARSSYSGIIDLAGFKKDRFYLYQSRWRPELPLVHILPHWNWPGCEGQVTPVHVFTSGDEVELFLNGRTLGRKAKGRYEYRLRWDDAVYMPGELTAVAYKDGREWARQTVRTTGSAQRLEAVADRTEIRADGKDLVFVTVRITDKDGLTVPGADNLIRFCVEGPGEIVATDNGDPSDLTAFPSPRRKALSGLCLVVVKGKPGQSGTLRIHAASDGLEPVALTVKSDN
ncbi:MAG: beta-galactosidase GalB [Breznakibacter sp.]